MCFMDVDPSRLRDVFRACGPGDFDEWRPDFGSDPGTSGREALHTLRYGRPGDAAVEKRCIHRIHAAALRRPEKWRCIYRIAAPIRSRVRFAELGADVSCCKGRRGDPAL